jgi:hypothetical protein
MRDFEEAQAKFMAVRKRDPYRLENLERWAAVAGAAASVIVTRFTGGR